MSLVRYINKKTGWVSVYESTSHYDPVTKKSRPKRKYIGYEDPITHEFVPSSGKAGRKKKSEDQPKSPKSNNSVNNNSSVSEIEKMRSEIQDLRREVRTLRKHISDINAEANRLTKFINKIVYRLNHL